MNKHDSSVGMLQVHPDLRPENGYREDDLKHRKFNTCTNRTGHHYIRVLKSFESAEIPNPSSEEVAFRSAPLVRNFVLRFYLPKEPISLKPNDENLTVNGKDLRLKSNLPLNEGIKHVVIMVNGLDEYRKDNLIFYDTMASDFAEQGIASVLLSTPYHMHRVARNTYSDLVRPGDGPFMQPSKYFKTPLDFFIHFKQTVLDIERLIRKIKQKRPTKADYDFYTNNFSPDVKVTVLGYSLGGLISLATLVKGSIRKKRNILWNKSHIDNCILYNTAPYLHSASIDARFGKSKEFWDRFNEPDEFRKVMANNPEKNEMLGQLFFRLYGGQSAQALRDIKKVIKDNKEKFFLVMSGNDDIVDITPWDDFFSHQSGPRKKTMINQYIVAGAGHSPMNEAQGAESLPKVLDIIISHILTNKLSHWQRPDILDLAGPIVSTTGYYQRFVEKKLLDIENPKMVVDFSEFDEFDRRQMDAILDELGKERARFLMMYHLSKIYYPKFRDLMKDLWKIDEKNPGFKGSKRAK